MTAYADIEPLAPEWLWPGRILQAGVTLVAGTGGCGKSFLAAGLAARVTRGQPMPDGSPGPLPGSVILVTAEDSPSMTVVHRLRAAGADLGRVHDLTEGFSVPGSLGSLRQLCDDLGDVRLVVLDPLTAIAECTLGQNLKVRRTITEPLEALARESGAAILVVHHLVKSGSVAGSQGLVDAMRSVLKVSRGATDPDLRVLSVSKSNVGDDQAGPVAYRLAGEGLGMRVEFTSVPADTATDAESPRDRVLAALRVSESPVDGQTLARVSGVGYSNTRVLLHRLSREGLAYSPSRGLWTTARAGKLAAVQ